ncbi:hypothetical protein EW145_g4503 [Phellinidium pouzarii]|uniref:Cytochrome P450 n=1 Tax=Phellinidium pouzarii TaxID=167371 RepID=A0A4S4L868_9AGAM|nr:hypothetical protein EW145_g4503 [Phellinidium pouzarii]
MSAAAYNVAVVGPISSVSVPGTTIIILNEAEACFDLLDKRSAIYSERPFFQFGGEMVGLSGTTTLLPCGPEFKIHRKEFHKYIGTAAAMKRFIELEEIETLRFLFRLLDEPAKLVEHIRTTAGAIILKISHGYTVAPHGSDPFVDLADAVLEIFSASLVPGAWIVDILPPLRHLPDWLPGLGFKKTARKWNAATMDLINKPFEFVKHQMVSVPHKATCLIRIHNFTIDNAISQKLGSETPSFASSLIERNVSNEYNMKWMSATMYGGGADTTVSAVTTFFLAMIRFPAVLKKAQAEVDRVIGRARLPSYADRERLPQMSHDPAIYHDPFTFKPERFLGENPEPDPRNLAFGFGRRCFIFIFGICPGKELADSSLFLSVAMVVAAFYITHAKDSSGRSIEAADEYSPGIISHPRPFDYSIKPRDEKAVSLIRAILDDHPFDSGDAGVLSSL